VTCLAGGTRATYRGGMTVQTHTGDDPQVDPHYLELLRGSKLPQAYLPPAMAGPQRPWVRVAATIVIGVFLLATVCGVCLTYGVGGHAFS
jgi:hypothetical protein